MKGSANRIPCNPARQHSLFAPLGSRQAFKKVIGMGSTKPAPKSRFPGRGPLRRTTVASLFAAGSEPRRGLRQTFGFHMLTVRNGPLFSQLHHIIRCVPIRARCSLPPLSEPTHSVLHTRKDLPDPRMERDYRPPPCTPVRFSFWVFVLHARRGLPRSRMKGIIGRQLDTQ